MYQVIKRDGHVAEFSLNRISSAIMKAFDATHIPYAPDVIDLLSLQVTADYADKIRDGRIDVETIQDSVEAVLQRAGYAEVAKAYILYRKNREKLRNMSSTILDPEKCTNCGACMKACPRGLITSVPASKKVHVACANLDKGKAAMSVCGNSCIGCGLCEKECKKDAIHVVNGVAVIDYDKCVGCKLCTKVCPRDAILPKATAEEKEKYKAIKKAQAEKAAAAKKAAEEAAPQA